jgi:hypothetical protein
MLSASALIAIAGTTMQEYGNEDNEDENEKEEETLKDRKQDVPRLQSKSLAPKTAKKRPITI